MRNKKLDQITKKDISINSIIKTVMTFMLCPLKYILPKKYIIFSGTTHYNYNGNCRCLFEYLSKNSYYEVYWFTRSKEVKKYLEENNFNLLSYSNPLKLIIISAMAKIVFNDGDDYLNIFRLSDTRATKKISMGHGIGPKTTISAKDDEDARSFRVNRINKFDYINFPSSYLANNIARNVFEIPNRKVKTLGYPRSDNFFIKEYCKKKYIDKPLCKKIFPNLTKESKVILYTPTWRPYEYNLPILDLTGFKNNTFSNFLIENNLYFIYSVHSARKPKVLLDHADRIKLMDEKVYPLYDTSEMMLESSILLNDYSATSVEFSILDRPQVFCMPDYDKYNKKKGFLEDYKKNLPGKSVSSFDELINLFIEILEKTENYTSLYERQRKNLLEKYYNLENNKSIESYSKFLSVIINGDISK